MMGWGQYSIDEWLEAVDDLADARMSDELQKVFRRFRLVPSGGLNSLCARLHTGDIESLNDLIPPALVAAVDGNLVLGGSLNTQAIKDADGQATFVVFGDVRCNSLIMDWGSLIFISGDCHVEDWAFIAREDCSLIAGGSFTANKFIGADIWIEAGGKIEIEYGYGYGKNLDADVAGLVQQTMPSRHWRELGLQLGGEAASAVDETALLDILDTRLYQTGTIYDRP